MSASAAKPKSARSADVSELFPPMRFGEKVCLVAVCCVLLAPAITIGWWVVGPTDPFGAVTIVYHDNPLVALVALIVFAGVGSSLATLAMRGRLTHFGVFAVGVGLSGLGLRGGDLTALLQYEAGSPAARGAVFGSLAVDVLLWTLVPAVSFAACAVTEAWAGLTGPAGSNPVKDGAHQDRGVLTRWLKSSADRTGAAAHWKTEFRHGPLALVVTGVVAMVVIRMAVGRSTGPVNPGQVCFAIGVGFWLGALAAGQFARPALSVWACLAVPVVALIGFVAAAANPELSGALGWANEIVIIAPNALAKGLPVNYLAVGPAAALLGVWTGQRLQRARAEAAES